METKQHIRDDVVMAVLVFNFKCIFKETLDPALDLRRLGKIA